MDETLLVPAFARLIDYSGFWLVNAFYANRILASLNAIDLQAHIQQGAEPLKSAMQKIPAGNGDKSIAVIDLAGLLMKSQSSMGGTSTVQARRDIRNAAADPNVAGILLNIDSPGGTVAGTYDLANEIKTADKVKPVWSAINDLGASAAYWAASQSRRIFANAPTALVGSIGTIQQMQDTSAAAERDGRRTLVFSTGPLKGMGADGTKITEEQAAHVQGLVDSVQKSFDAAVQKGRDMSAKELAAVRHGGVLTASDAKDAKLIDGIQPLHRTLQDFAAELRNGASRSQAMNECVGSLPMLVRG